MSDQFNDILTELESWYGGERGGYLLRQLRETLRPHLENAFGYHMLQIGPVRGQSLFGDCRINHRIHASQSGGEGIGLICESGEIPLESDSVDVVIAHHSLEFVENPHQVLREIQRVLTAQGQLLIIGFNPFSVRGAATALRACSPRSAWRQHQPVSARRLTDWLHLLGCELQDSHYVYTLPALGSGRLRRGMESLDGWCTQHNLPLGGVYVLHAIKTVIAQNRPRSRLRRHGEKLIDLAVPKPAVAPSPAPRAPAGSGSIAARNGRGDSLH
ncbi:class I SAM-dependent methyltransferase [Pseudohalioglobus lutimaris]|uniref:Class I SAM-dependent methyltransferase n=1 Tax=Pseudohalioglobus lutimaris TaxID=1737061 RepID=A0A2N5X321_9GAMM|nr:class I SAM-dependent methyltransferase [Pseudohalioglobus lutimaris]PLW68883.1 class I SAM-dependent methyltransferase [Pseudohalioglobus lutimaris]